MDNAHRAYYSFFIIMQVFLLNLIDRKLTK
jgi:hypothetical protein